MMQAAGIEKSEGTTGKVGIELSNASVGGLGTPSWYSNSPYC